MFVGLLRHTVTVRRRVAVLDAGLPTYTELGQPVTELRTVGTVRCRIEPLTSKELALQSQAGAIVATHRVYMTAAADVLEADQLVDGTRLYEVQRLDDLGGAGRYVEGWAQLVTSRDVPTTA